VEVGPRARYVSLAALGEAAVDLNSNSAIVVMDSGLVSSLAVVALCMLLRLWVLMARARVLIALRGSDFDMVTPPDRLRLPFLYLTIALVF